MTSSGTFDDRRMRLTTADLLAIGALLETTSVEPDERAVYEQLDALERLKGQVSARQAALAQDLTERQRERAEAEKAAGSGRRPVPPERVVGSQVALARRESPHRGRALVTLAEALRDLPETRAALTRGEIPERRAEIVVRGTSDLTREGRLTVDATLASDLPDLGDEKLRRRVRRLAIAVDDASEQARIQRVRESRRVVGRVLPDGTHQLTAYLAPEQYAAALATLHEAVATARAAGDPRTTGQVMADVLAESLSGSVFDGHVPAKINLTMPVETLLGTDDGPAILEHVGPIPAALARDIAGGALRNVRSLVRRLFTQDGVLVAMEQASRRFTGELAEFLALREHGVCRTPWCNATVKQRDHIRGVADGGATTADNGQGLCEVCNYVKEAGFRQEVASDTGEQHTVVTHTPAGLSYEARAPDQPEVPPGWWVRTISWTELPRAG